MAAQLMTRPQLTIEKLLHQDGVDVALAADGHGVDQLLGYVAQRDVELALALGQRFVRLNRTQLAERQHRSFPSAERLGREAHAKDASQVLIDVARADELVGTVGSHVLKQPLTRNVATTSHDA